MPKFVVRVELKFADVSDNRLLDENMENAGYRRTVQDAAGTWFELPSEQYFTAKKATVSEIRDEVKSLAQLVSNYFYILVTECTNTSWLLPNK